MSKIILIVGILLATSYFGDTDNLLDRGTKIGRNVWFPETPADSAVSKDTVDTNSRAKRSMAVVLPMESIRADGNNNEDVIDDEDDDDDDKEINRKNYKTKRCRGLPSYRKRKLYKEPEEDVVSYAIKNGRSLDPSKNIILQMGEDNQVSSEESDKEEQPYLRIATVKNPQAILKNILRSKSMQRNEESEINKDNAVLKRVKTHLRPEECNVLALIGKRAGSIRPNKPRKFVCYEDNNCGKDPRQMVLQAYPVWKKARPVFLKENNYGINTIPIVQQDRQFQKFAQAPIITQYSQPSVLAKSQNPIVGSQIISGILKTQSGTIPVDTRSGVQKQQFENIKNPPVLQLPEQPFNIQYGVPSGKINWQQLNKMASADSAIQRNGFVGQQIKSHASVQTPFRQNCVGTSYSGNNAIDQSNEKMLSQQNPIDHKIEDEYVGIEQTIPRGNEKSWSIGRTELGKSFRNVEDCIKLYGREFCVVDATSLSQWKNDAVHQIGLDSEDGHLSTDYSDRNILNYDSTPIPANYGYHNNEQTVDPNYRYHSRNPYTQLKYTSEQPFVAQRAQNKIIKESDESYETATTDCGYSTDHNKKETVGSNYQYDSRKPDTPLEYTSEQPFVAQTARNKLLTGSDESYETATTNFGYSTDHNEEGTAESNYQYDSRNPDTQLKHTSEQPFAAQGAQNKIIKESDESYETATTDCGYSTDHNKKETVGSNYQYDSRKPDTPLEYTSEQPFVAQTARNKLLTGSDESYETATTNFGYSTDHNEEGTAESNYQYDSRNPDTQLKHTSEQPFVAQRAQNKIIKESDESYETATTNFGYSTDHNEEGTAESNYQYDSRNPDTQLKHTSEQPFVAQRAQNKIIKESDESYETATTNFGYSTDHNEEGTAESNYQYDSRKPDTPLEYTSEQPFVAQTARNKLLTGSDESYETATTNFGYSTDHNEEGTAESNYQYDSRNPDTQLKHTSEQPFVAQRAQNKIIKESDESYETATTDCGYSTDHNKKETVGSNYQYDSRKPDTPLEYTSEQPFVAQTARNKLLTGSDESYETATTNFGYSTDHNEEGTAESNYQYDSRNPDTQLKHTSEQPFAAQGAQNKIIKESDESYETATTDCGYSTDHNKKETVGSNYQYDSRKPDTPLEYTSEQPFVAQTARNKLLTGSDESYETATTNFGYSIDHNEEGTAESNYQYDSRNPDTQLKYTSEQPFVAQRAQNKIIKESDESYETATTNFGYSTDHNEEGTAESNYQYDSRNPDTQLKYTSEQPFVAQRAQNKIIKESDESYETATTNFGYSTDHNEEGTAESNYQYDSRNPDTQLKYTSEQPFVAQRAQNKIIKESDESYETATTDCGYSTDHNKKETVGSNYQYDSRKPDTPLEYTSEQPFVAQTARNKLLTGSDESYETATTNFGYSTDHNEEGTAESNYQYDSRNPDTQLKHTSEQPFAAQGAQNKIIKESDESYETATTDCGYSTDHNKKETVGSNYQYDSRKPDTPLEYTSEQPFVAQTARNKLLTGSDESYETATTNFGYSIDHNEEGTAESNYQYDSRNPDTQLKYTSEQPFVAQRAQNKIIKESDESYETATTNFGYSTDHNEEGTAESNYQYDSRNPDTQLKYTSEQPFVAQRAQNKIIKESDESYETATTNFGYSTDHNEEGTAESNYQYDSRNPDTQLKYTSEQPFVAQRAQNKIIKESDESYETATTDCGYSTDHNKKETVGSNYQYDSRKPDTPLEYTSEQPFVAQTARNKLLTGSDESYETATTNFGYSTDHNEEGTAESNYQYDSRNPDTQLKHTSEQPFAAQGAQNKIIKESDESYETATTNFGYSTDHNEEGTAESNYQYDSRNPDTQLKHTSEQSFVAQTAQNKIFPGSAKSYEAVTSDFGYSPENNFNGQTSNYNMENNSKQRIQEDHVQQNQIGKNSNLDTSDYYNTGSQNSHIYQYEDNSVHNNNMKYNEQSLSHDTYGTYDTYDYTTQNYLVSQKQKPNLYSDSRYHIVDSPCKVPVTPYENDDAFYTTENNLQRYNDYSSGDQNDLKYPLISDDTRESSYADNTEPYTGNGYDSVQPEYYAMNKMPKTIQHDLQPPVIIGTEIPSLTQIEPTLLEHSTYPGNTIKGPLEMTNNHYEQGQLSRPSYDHIPSHHYTNINYFNDQLNNHQLGKAYTAQNFGNTEYINNNYNFNNYPNFYDTRVKNIWENSEGILSPDTRNEHIASSNMLREMSQAVQEHQPPGPEWDSERFSSVDNSKKSTAVDDSQIIEVTNGYSFVDDNFDKAYGMHTNDPASSTDLFINDRNDRFNPKFTDINDSQIERQPQDILGHVPYTDSLEKFVDSTSNVLQSVEYQTDGPGGIPYFGDSMKHLDEIENSATEVTYAESTETPYGEEDSSRDLGEKYSPSISVYLTSPHSRKCFITGTGEKRSSMPLQDLVGQSLHEESMEQSAETYTVGSKDMDLRNGGKIKSTIHAAEVNSNPSIDLSTDQESTLIRDTVGEYFGEGTRDKNIYPHDILISVTQNSDMVNLTPTENTQSIIYGPGEKLITSNNLPKDIGLTSASDTIGKPLNQKILKEYTDSYDTSEPVIPNTETADINIIGKSEDNKDIVQSDNRVTEPAMVGNSKCSVINNEKMITTREQEYSPDDDNYLKATIKSVINNFATNKDNDMVGSSKNSKSAESSNSKDLLPEIISTPMLKTLFALPEVENTLTDMVKETLSKSPYETKYRSILGSESDAIKSILRDVIAEIENSLPTDYPITVEEHEFKEGHWVTEQVTLMPTVPAEKRVQIPFGETVNKIILQTLKNVVTSPILGSKAASRPVVQNVIMETIKNALRKANVNTASIDDSALREVLDNLIKEMKADVPSATGSLRNSFDSSTSILGQSIDENTKIPLTENNRELEKWTTTDNIQTQIEDPENLNSKEIFENNYKEVLLTSTDNYDEKSSILGQTVDMSDYGIPKESLLNDKKIFNHVLSTNPGINDAFSSSADSIIINDEKASQTATEAEDYKMLREFNEEEYHRVSSESNDESPSKSVQSEIVHNTQVDESDEENVQAAHFTTNDNDYPLKSLPGSNFDKIQIDKSIQENLQAAHSNPILSSSVISKCSNVSPDRMISHTPPEDVSASSEEIMDDTSTITKYPNLTFDNEYTQHILGMTEKLPSDEDFSLKSSQGSNFDKIQIDKSIQENLQAAHSNPILSSSVIGKCSNVSPDRMISHTPPEDVSASSEEIIDDTLTVTEYPNLKFDNENTEYVLGMTEKIPAKNYNDVASISSTDLSNNSPAVATKTIGKVSSKSEVADINNLLEKTPTKYYSPNDRILEYKKNHLQQWNTESMTNMPLGNDMVKESVTGSDQGCRYSTIRKNSNDYYDNTDTTTKINSLQYNNNEIQKNEYMIGNNREIVTPDKDKKVNQEMIKSKTSSAILESTMNIMPNSKINDYDDTENQTENNLEQFTSDGIVGKTEPQDAIEGSKKKYMDINSDESGTEDISNEEYISSVSEKNIQSDSSFENTQEKSMFDETAVNTSLDEETFGDVEDDSKLTATQEENRFFETTVSPSSDEETFIHSFEQYDESEMAPDIIEEEASRSKEHVELAESRENKKFLEKLNDNEEVSDVSMSKMTKDISDEEISKSEEYANLESEKSEESLETLIDSKELNDLDNVSYDSAKTTENLGTSNSPTFKNDDYHLAESQEYSSKLENAQGEAYKKNLKHNLEHSASQYLGASKSNTGRMKNIQMGKSTRMGIPILESSNQNKMLKQTRKKDKLIPTKSHEIITKTIKKTITKTTKYYGAEDSIEDATVNSPNNEMVSATKSSCFSDSDHDLTYFGKLLPKCGKNQGNDISELTNSDLYYIGDGVRLPLTIKKLDDGSYGLSISEKVCEHFMNTRCPCCVPRDGTIVSEKRNSHEGRNLKRDLWKLSKKSFVEGERDSNEKVQDEVGKSKTRHTRSTPAVISEIQNNDEIIIPESHSTSLRSMPVQEFAKKYNLILDLAKHSVSENVQKTVTEADNNKSILNNDEGIEHGEKEDLTQIEENFSKILNKTNGNKIFDGNQTSNLVKSLIAINDAPESERAGIVINALKNLIEMGPTEIYTVVDGQEKKVEILNMEHVEEDSNAAQDEEIAKYGYQKDNPILGRIKFIKRKQKEQGQHMYQQIDDNDVADKMEILKVILHWLKDVILRIPAQNKS